MGKFLIAFFTAVGGGIGSFFAAKENWKSYKAAKAEAHASGKKWTWE